MPRSQRASLLWVCTAFELVRLTGPRLERLMLLCYSAGNTCILGIIKLHITPASGVSPNPFGEGLLQDSEDGNTLSRRVACQAKRLYGRHTRV